jgi:hypothetical protein
MKKVNKKKSRAKYECDPVLEEFIARANLCSFDFPFESSSYENQIQREGKTETDKKIFNIVTTELSLETKEYLENLLRNDLGKWIFEEFNSNREDLLEQNEMPFFVYFTIYGIFIKQKEC